MERGNILQIIRPLGLLRLEFDSSIKDLKIDGKIQDSSKRKRIQQPLDNEETINKFICHTKQKPGKAIL